MKDIPQLREDFSLYFQEIQRCQQSKCYFALLHILLAIPDVCASLETDPAHKALPEVGKRYVAWCNTYMPASSTISGSDGYQMRNALIQVVALLQKTWGKGIILVISISVTLTQMISR